MGLGKIARAGALTTLLSAGCAPDTTNMSCDEIKESIAAEQASDTYPAANIDGAMARQAGEDFRIRTLKAAAFDKGCKNSSPNRDWAK